MATIPDRANDGLGTLTSRFSRFQHHHSIAHSHPQKKPLSWRSKAAFLLSNRATVTTNNKHPLKLLGLRSQAAPPRPPLLVGRRRDSMLDKPMNSVAMFRLKVVLLIPDQASKQATKGTVQANHSQPMGNLPLPRATLPSQLKEDILLRRLSRGTRRQLLSKSATDLRILGMLPRHRVLVQLPG